MKFSRNVYLLFLNDTSKTFFIYIRVDVIELVFYLCPIMQYVFE